MPKRTKDQLKSLFSRGKRPSDQDFADLIDSLIHVDQQRAVDEQIVNTLINNFSTLLTNRNSNGAVDSLGDVYAVLSGYDDARHINDELKWSGLPGKPAGVDVTWPEQVLVTDFTTYNPDATAGTNGAGAAQRWLLQNVGGLPANRYVITDIRTERHFVTSNGTSGNFFDQIIGVRIGITPKVSFA